MSIRSIYFWKLITEIPPKKEVHAYVLSKLTVGPFFGLFFCPFLMLLNRHPEDRLGYNDKPFLNMEAKNKEGENAMAGVYSGTHLAIIYKDRCFTFWYSSHVRSAIILSEPKAPVGVPRGRQFSFFVSFNKCFIYIPAPSGAPSYLGFVSGYTVLPRSST